MNRTEKIMIRLTGDEKVRVNKAAQAQGLAAASWGRMQLLRATNESHWTRPVAERKGPELLSLLCGPGGLDQGFKEAGFYTRVAIDIDPECIRTFQHNHPESHAEVGDVTELTLGDLDGTAGREIHPVGVIGGPPCQSFSVSNVHQREDDPRHQLPEAYARLLDELNKRHPISFFLFENVPGLLGKKHRPKYEKFKTLFKKAGFETKEAPLNAADYGVPQERLRIFVVGINKKKHPGVRWAPPRRIGKKQTVRAAIGGLPEPERNAPGLDPEVFAVHPNHWCMVPRSEKFKNGALKAGEMLGRSFRRLSWDKPSWTVAYGNREVHVHPEGHRRRSVYEAMRLQSFPETYRFTGNISAQIRLVSEAVPPLMAKHIARSIRRCLGI